MIRYPTECAYLQGGLLVDTMVKPLRRVAAFALHSTAFIPKTDTMDYVFWTSPSKLNREPTEHSDGVKRRLLQYKMKQIYP
jgi:hypothetical protein